MKKNPPRADNSARWGVIFVVVLLALILSVILAGCSRGYPTEARVMGRYASAEWSTNAKGERVLGPTYYIVVQREDCPGYLAVPVGETSFEVDSTPGSTLHVGNYPCSEWTTIHSLDVLWPN